MLVPNGSNKLLRNTIVILQKFCVGLQQATNHRSMAKEPETLQQSTIWVFLFEPDLRQIIRARSTTKNIFPFTPKKQSCIKIFFTKEQIMVNFVWRTIIYLPKIIKQTRTARLFFLSTQFVQRPTIRALKNLINGTFAQNP